MKTKFFASMFLAVLICMSARLASAEEVVGGYLNTHDEEGAIVYALSANTDLVVSFSKSAPQGVSGRLIVVSPNGSWREYTRAVKDALGVVVTPRSGAHNKFIFIDDKYRIVGASGLDESEFSALIRVNSKTMVLAQKWRLGGAKTIFDSIRLVADVFQRGYRMSEDEQLAAFSSHLRFLEPWPVSTTIAKILDAAAKNDRISVDGLESLVDSSIVEAGALARGIGVISEGDNGGGGPGLVSEGDNGGGGPGLVAEGDNGGGGPGLVAEGDNGGGGPGYVIEGWGRSGHVSLPQARNCRIPMSGDALFIAIH